MTTSLMIRMVHTHYRVALLMAIAVSLQACQNDFNQSDGGTTHPNIVLIYTDDLGYADVSSYGATSVETPNIDRLADEGTRFSQAYAPSATCTPSRYALLTGEYAWRREGTGIARGDASMIIEAGRTTLPSILQDAGYRTAVVGKWHLGLGGEKGPDWNGEINPGPLEIGFDEAFLIPATGDRVPTVYVRDHNVVDLNPSDPIEVSFRKQVGDEPTGKENPELLKMHPSHGHDQTIVNGISRIGYMSGGQAARWIDEDMADVITKEGVSFIERNKEGPFFLYYSTHDIHVPRVPHERFTGLSGLGPRGDVILQLDWAVGEIVSALERNGLSENTLVIFTSDNGPVLDDGYQDLAVELQGDHHPSGPFRGGKYSAFEAGTRVPFIVRWPEKVERADSEALFSQVDLMGSLAALVGQQIALGDAPDSRNQLSTLLGEDPGGRDHIIEHNSRGTLSIRKGQWKYISPSDASPYNRFTDIELGNDPAHQLYDLSADIGEQHNVAPGNPEIVDELSSELDRIRNQDDK